MFGRYIINRMRWVCKVKFLVSSLRKEKIEGKESASKRVNKKIEGTPPIPNLSIWRGLKIGSWGGHTTKDFGYLIHLTPHSTPNKP